MARKTKNKEKHIKLRVIIFLLLVAILASTYFFSAKIEDFVNFYYNKNALSTNIDEGGLKVHFINVEQADAILVEFPTGEKMLIDSGDKDNSSQKLLKDYLEKIDFQIEDGEKVLDYFVLTHPDNDHMGGAVSIFENYKVKTFIRPNVKYKDKNDTNPDEPGVFSTNNEQYNSILCASLDEVGCMEIIHCAGLPIKSDSYSESKLNVDNRTWLITFLSPIADCLPYDNTNNYSPVMILEYMGKKIMFTGDAEKEVENDIVENTIDKSFLDVDILKAGHHGSRGSSTAKFLSYVKPEYVVISVGKNSYNHPNPETIERYKDIGLTDNDIYTTQDNGNILVGISTSGELCLVSDYVQYTTFKIQWWYMFSAGVLICTIVIFFPLISKRDRKKLEKEIKTSSKKSIKR